MEKYIQYLIFIHVTLGGVALISGTVALIVKKGKKIHKQFGNIFYYTMMGSVTLSLFISLLPKHESPFLFSIGLFSIYLLIGGHRSLKFKDSKHKIKYDRWIARAMIIIGFAMVIYGWAKDNSLNMVLIFFGVGGIFLGARDLILFYKPEQAKKRWIIAHLTKMTGGYIASVTAFFVVNDLLPGTLSWYVPTIVGTVFITYQTRKFKSKKDIKTFFYLLVFLFNLLCL